VCRDIVAFPGEGYAVPDDVDIWFSERPVTAMGGTLNEHRPTTLPEVVLSMTPAEALEEAMRTTVRTLLCLIAMLVAVPATIANADAVYPSQHIALHPVGTAPLRTGFVENIHANGPNVYAHEVYVVAGAAPRTSYDVTISVFVQDPGCSTTPLVLQTATLTTNAAGSGRADVVFSPADADGLRGASHGAIWSLSVSGAPVYQTACSTIVLD
jgi:hypothetical protein